MREAGTYMPSSLSASMRYFKPHTLLVGPLLALSLSRSLSFVPHTVLLLLPQRKGSEPGVSDVCGSGGPTSLSNSSEQSEMSGRPLTGTVPSGSIKTHSCSSPQDIKLYKSQISSHFQPL